MKRCRVSIDRALTLAFYRPNLGVARNSTDHRPTGDDLGSRLRLRLVKVPIDKVRATQAGMSSEQGAEVPHIAHILVGDSDPDRALARAEELGAAGYRTMQVSDAASLVKLASSRVPDAVMVGGFSGTPDGIEIAAALKGADTTRHIPVILIGGDTTKAERARALAAGVDDLLPVDADGAEILARLPRLVRSAVMLAELYRRTESASRFDVRVDPRSFQRGYPDRPRVLAVAENGESLSGLQRTLERAGFQAVPERSAFRAGDRLDDERFDATVVRVDAGDDIERVLFLCAHIRNNPRLFNQPTLVSAPGTVNVDRTALYRGGAGIAMIGAADDDLLSMYTHMLVARQRLRWTLRDPFKATLAEGTRDELKGVYSRAFFDAHLERVLGAARNRGSNLSLGIVRIANVTGLEEDFGAEETAALMQQLSNWVGGMTRIEDTVARLGHADFAMILTDTPEIEAMRVIQRIAGILQQSEFHMSEEVMQPIHVWVQTGVVGIAPDDTAQGILARAMDAVV